MGTRRVSYHMMRLLAPLRQNTMECDGSGDERDGHGGRKMCLSPAVTGHKGTQLGDTGTSAGWNTVDGLDEVKQPNLQTELLFVESEVLGGR